MLNAVRVTKLGCYLEGDDTFYPELSREKDYADLFRRKAFGVAESAIRHMTLSNPPIKEDCESKAKSLEDEADFLQEVVNKRRKMAQALRGVCK